MASERWGFPAAMGDALTAVEFFHPGSVNPGLVHVCTALIEGVVAADFTNNFHWSANTPAISVRGVQLRWTVFDAELSAPGELLSWEFRLVWSCACGCRCVVWSASALG